ncbi:MAG: UDP-N-acetylglucosamine 1-carboxyvinyltransferase [Acutalibacteraceae bacterium]|nr:UDP-N-acetylglucosamine 1-carboxyvinyltransferase [Acutalibacteraceae bacterium]
MTTGITITGGRKINGKISLHGAKNSVLPILAATTLIEGVSVIHNCPKLTDVSAAIQILEHLGANVTLEDDTVTVDCSEITRFDIPEELMREMRSSIVFLGAIAARMGKASLCSPGGCELGPRPIDLHLNSLSDLGVEVEESHGLINCTCSNGICGASLHLSFPSVGATENIILAAVTAKGVTVIHGAAREPEISDLADFLNRAGANIQGAGSDVITVCGVKSLHGTEHTVIPDRIEAATYLAAAAVTGGKITLDNAIPAHLTPVMSVLKSAGCEIKVSNRQVSLTAPVRLKRVPVIRTMPHPGFPTDAGSPLMAMLSLADGSSMFVENIFENRFRIVDELKRFGAKIYTNGRVAVIEGVRNLSGASVECTDLRGGAALVIAALAANGTSEINKIYHIDRGYENLCENLKILGAEAQRF